MNFKKIFSRNKETTEITSDSKQSRVFCNTPTLKELIIDWTCNENWEFENFADFIELIGVKTPVMLSNLNKDNNSFKCISGLNDEVLISLRFGDWFENCSEIIIIKGEEERRYSINSNTKKGISVPSVTLENRNIKRNGKELDSHYSEYSCHRTLKLDDTHTLKIEIDEPAKSTPSSSTFVLRNCVDIENYLLSLDNSLTASEVYDSIMCFLRFSDEDISNSKKILISYIETTNKRERVLSKILLANGKMQEYAVLQNGEVFHVFNNGSWMYSSDIIRIACLEELEHYIFSVRSSSKENIINTNPSEIMSRVEKKISELWKFVK